MKEIKITIRDNMDLHLLLSGINFLRGHNIRQAKEYLSLPTSFKSDIILKDLIDDFDRLNNLATQISKYIEKEIVCQDCGTSDKVRE